MIRKIILLALVLAPHIPAQQIYDLLLRNGHVIDPANHRNGRFDIAIVGKRIVRIGNDLPTVNARVVIDASQYDVTPGLVDVDVHLTIPPQRVGSYLDYNTLPSGVTTVVDVGSSNGQTFEEFKTRVIEHAKTRVLAFLTSSMEPDTTVQAIRRHADLIVGVKAVSISSEEEFDRAVKTAAMANTVLLAERATNKVAQHMRSGDINLYSGTESWIAEARHRGVQFDTDASFEFRTLVPAIQQKILPDTISSGMNGNNLLLQRANMATTMSKFLNMGMSLEQMIERTTANPARQIRHPELGTLREGGVADIALFEIQQGKFGFLDSGLAKLDGTKRVRCVLTIRDGAVVWDSDGLAATDWIKAGPYSNFK